MQTFLPYPDFARSAACLDYRRLGKQRVEAKQILNALADPAYGWQHHPAVQMWRGHDMALACYGWWVCREWRMRGYQDTLFGWFNQIYISGSIYTIHKPSWCGDGRFHASHRAALLAKDPAHYSQFGWTETPAINYWWPTKHNEVA